MKKAFLILGVSTLFVTTSCNQKDTSEKTNDNVDFLSSLEFKNGYPTNETSQKLYDEMDLHRATQAYIWGFPLVSSASIRRGLFEDMGMTYSDIIVYENFLDTKSIWFTGNNTTIYGVSMIDLSQDGPVVVELPKAPQAGMLNDFWFRTHGIGNLGPDKSQGGKYLIVPPNYEGELQEEGFFKIQSEMYNYMFFMRGFVENDDKQSAVNLFHNIKIYPYKDRENPAPNNVLESTGKHINTIEPDGMDYWKLLSEVLNANPIEERDRAFMAMLKPLGIEKGKPFNPTERQKEILIKGAELGKMMSQTICFNPRIEEATAYEGTNWKHTFTMNTTQGEWQEAKNYTQLDERMQYLYLATWPGEFMNYPHPSNGQRYLESFKDKDGNWLDGSKNYKLHVPADVPSIRFWSVTVYDNKTRSMTMNEENRAAVTSYDDLTFNEEGSVDLYFGPEAPDGLENNWVNTSASEGWFVWFRFYGTTEAFFDKTWQLQDFEKLE
jgi:hypothetical protein